MPCRDADSHGFMFTAPDHDIPGGTVGGIKLFPHLHWGFQCETETTNTLPWEKPGGGGIFQVMTFWQQQSH